MFGQFFVDENLPNLEIFVFELLKELKKQGTPGIVSKKVIQALAAYLKAKPKAQFNSTVFHSLVENSWRTIDLEGLKLLLEMTGLRLSADV